MFLQGYTAHIDIDEKVTPIAQHMRRVPIALKEKVSEKIDQLLEADIIERVDGASPWVSPLVVVLKDSGDVRLCVDMRRANAAIRRENHPIPTFDDFLCRLSKAKWFSRLDIKEAFHQVELAKNCRHITTFISHRGMFRYKRLMFGVSSAPEAFQKIIEQICIKCKNVFIFMDDILVVGETEEVHDQALKELLDTLRSHRILLNWQKCQFKTKETKFMGHQISELGVRPGADKLLAIKDFRAPKTAEELRSFLGLTSYIGRFIPDLATKTFELRELTKMGKDYIWTEKHDAAFQILKNSVAAITELAYFEPGRRTRVVADASTVGLGAVLVQFEDETDQRPVIISFASKSLSETERRYSQTEKEALGLVWGVERFKDYLIGTTFELETDHKPLTYIFSPTSTPTARLERWVLRLQAFRYRVIYRKGKENVADPLSRLPTSVTKSYGKDFDEADEEAYIHAVLESAAIDLEEIKDATELDTELQAVKQALTTGDWSEVQISAKDYAPFQRDLCLVGGFVIRGSQLLVPKVLRQRMLELGHEGHPGEQAMIRRLRDRVWWPGVDKAVKDHVKRCEGCILVSHPSVPEPMRRRQMPMEAWVDIAMDFLGPLPSGEYILVVVDYFSRYKEVEVMTKITAEGTIRRLEPIFVRNGYPTTITLDNGRQFVSNELDEYCRIRNITLNHTVPYWPQANGEVERQNRSLLKRLKISKAQGRAWRDDLNQYLLMYNTTPHTTTGQPPARLMQKRTIRSKIPGVQDIETMVPRETGTHERDWTLKFKAAQKENEKRNAKPSDIKVGDTVLMQNLLPMGKLRTTFNKTLYEVVDRSGSRVTIEDKQTGSRYDRNVAHLKRFPQREEEGTVALNPTIDSEQVDQRTEVVLEDVPGQSTSASNHSPETETRNQRRTTRRPACQRDYKVNHVEWKNLQREGDVASLIARGMEEE